MLEQPLTSVLHADPAIRDALRSTAAVRVVCHLGKYGGTSLKPIALYGTTSWLPELGADSASRAMPAGRNALAVKKGRWTSGKKGTMTESACYPCEFCDKVAWLQAKDMPTQGSLAAALSQVLPRSAGAFADNDIVAHQCVPDNDAVLESGWATLPDTTAFLEEHTAMGKEDMGESDARQCMTLADQNCFSVGTASAVALVFQAACSSAGTEELLRCTSVAQVPMTLLECQEVLPRGRKRSIIQMLQGGRFSD